MNAMTDELTPVQAAIVNHRLDALTPAIDRAVGLARRLPAIIRKSQRDMHCAVVRSAAETFRKAVGFLDDVLADEDAAQHHDEARQHKEACEQHAVAMDALHKQLAQAGVADGQDEFAVNSARPTHHKASACACGAKAGSVCRCSGGACQCEPGHPCNACFRPRPGEIALLHPTGTRMEFSSQKDFQAWLGEWATTPAFGQAWLGQATMVEG